MIIIVIWGDGGSLRTNISVIIIISPSSLSSSSSHRHLQTERVAFQTRCRASSRCRTAGAACSGRSPSWERWLGNRMTLTMMIFVIVTRQMMSAPWMKLIVAVEVLGVSDAAALGRAEAGKWKMCLNWNWWNQNHRGYHCHYHHHDDHH